MANVVSFDSFDDESEIATYHAGLPRIVLEGQDDVRLFKTYWFPSFIDSFEFVEAADIVEGRGCTAVCNAVLRSRQDNIPAFGISDRDHLFRTMNWALLFTVDNLQFEAGTRSDDFYTTLRWEVEAYLLEPDLLPAWVRSYRKKPGSDAQCAAALSEAIDECEHLLRANRFFATAHACGENIPEKYFSDRRAHELAAACADGLRRLADSNEVTKEIDKLTDAVLEAAPSEPSARLQWLLRYVDTKRLLVRLQRRFQANPEVRWFLAELMLQSDRRPHELEGKLAEFRDQVPS